MNEQELLQTRLDKLNLEAKAIEIAGLQREIARKARIAEKEIERAKVWSSCGPSFGSISTVESPDANLTKVSGWIVKTEEGGYLAQSVNVPSVYQQTSVTAPVITVRWMHGGQCTAQVRDLEPSVKPTISTQVANRGFGNDRTKTLVGAGNQRGTAQPEVNFATSKPSITRVAGQSWLPPTNGGSPSSVFDVP